jgi:ATP-dependent Clp protease ATP-binding subunit ClpX
MTNNAIRCTFCKKSRDESLKMVVSGTYSICDKCVFLFGGLLKSTATSTIIPKTIEKKQLADQLDSLKIRNFVDQYVIGQEPAKMSLCVSVVNHYKRMLYGRDHEDLNKSNLMITGPSGSGKSLLISTIAKFLDVPFVSVDATTLTEAGYIGQNVDTIMTRLVVEAQGDISSAENGIVFLDEIDKIASGKVRTSTTDGRVSGVQSALLRMVEGTRITLNINTDTKRMPKITEIDTSNILFICGGAFIGLNEITANRLKKKKGLGFTDVISPTSAIETEYSTEDFIEFGMIPEFVGRFPMKTYTKELTESELKMVLSNQKNSLLMDYKFYFNVDKIELEFTDDFLDRVANQAKIEKTGVRGLRSICDAIMMPHLYLIPEYKKRNVAKLTFYGDCVDKKQIPKIDQFEKKLVAKKAKM